MLEDRRREMRCVRGQKEGWGVLEDRRREMRCVRGQKEGDEVC